MLAANRQKEQSQLKNTKPTGNMSTESKMPAQISKYKDAMPENACFGCWGEAKHIYADLNCCDNCKAALERVECLYNERDLKSFDALRAR